MDDGQVGGPQMGLRRALLALACTGMGAVALGLSSAGASSVSPENASAAAAQSLIRNGGFEEPVLERPWRPFFAGGERRIPGWRVVRHSVDIVGTDRPAGHGSQSLGVNGFRPGWVSQRVPTEANTVYRLSFLVWGDPNGPPPLSELAVRWDLHRIQLVEVDVRSQPTWRRISLLVQSTAAGTPLGFRGLTPGNAGPAIDAVRLIPLKHGE